MACVILCELEGHMGASEGGPTGPLLSNLFVVWDGHRDGGAGNGSYGVGGATKKKSLDDGVVIFKLC